MPLTDTNGRSYKLSTDLHPGDKVEVDAGFTCMKPGDLKEVKCGHNQDDFYIECSEERHYLGGQLDYRDNTDALIGIYPAED
jgi:hypothetical protein